MSPHLVFVGKPRLLTFRLFFVSNWHFPGSADSDHKHFFKKTEKPFLKRVEKAFPWEGRKSISLEKEKSNFLSRAEKPFPLEPGLEIRSLVFWANCLLFVSERAICSRKIANAPFFKERWEQFVHSHSFAKEQCKQFTLGHKKGKNSKTHTKSLCCGAEIIYFWLRLRLWP